MLVLDGVGKRYGRGPWVVRDVGLSFAPGEVCAVVGDNGSGKSTLLRVIVGVSRPTRGAVTGRPGVVGYVPDRFPPNERLSAMDYLAHLGRMRGLSTHTARSRADDLLERLSLAGGKHAAVRTLSKGNAQKVALAQALLVRPRLLVLDEPWSGLDTSAHAALTEIMGEVSQAGGTIVFTDHRESVTQVHASRTYRILAGQVTTAAAGQPTVHVVVVPPAHGGGPDWRSLPGVVSTSDTDDEVSLHVSAEHSDQVLVTALGDGWSVRYVGPAVARA